jgi:hypothetical protein
MLVPQVTDMRSWEILTVYVRLRVYTHAYTQEYMQCIGTIFNREKKKLSKMAIEHGDGLIL